MFLVWKEYLQPDDHPGTNPPSGMGCF